jgi:small subunit ribosomal protein S8
MAGHSQFRAPHSKINQGILEILKKEGYIADVEVLSEGKDGKRKVILTTLKYRREGVPAFERISRVSKPGQRIYRKAPEKREVRSGYGLQILSTSIGLMTDKEAIEKKVGGEIIAELW